MEGRPFIVLKKEKKRDVTGNWDWLIPPLSPTTTHVFHNRYNNEIKKPNYFSQKPLY
jgi:nitric-oxide synthase